MTGSKTKKSQPDKFREAAREHETDQSEEAFDRALRKVAKLPSAKKDSGTDSKK